MKASADPAAGWLQLLQSLADRVAHDLRNEMNGVAVNLEVVRGRMSKGGDVASIAPFAANASEQFERMSRRTMALLALVRPVHGPVEISATMHQLADLLGSGNGEAAPLRVSVELDGLPATTSAPDSVVRLLLASAVAASLEGTHGGSCTLAAAHPLRMYIQRDDGQPVVIDEFVSSIARAHGIGVEGAGPGLCLTFPPPPGIA